MRANEFGTNPKRPQRAGARPSRGHEPQPGYTNEEQSVEETARMSASVKLQRAFDRERSKSDASRKRGEEVMAQARTDWEKKQAAEKNKEQGVAEAINPDITNPEFSHQQQIGDYLYVARYWSKGLKITAYDGAKKIGYAELMYQSAPFDDFADPKTTPKRIWLESEWTKVDPKYQRQGIMSTMYAYAKMLGNSVKPSQTRSDDAKAAWKSWRDAGDAQHLTREGVVEAFGPLPKDNQQIRLGRHTVDIERVGKDKNYISFAWNDSQGQEHYEEVAVGDLGSYDDLIDRIKDEIRYQERQYTDQSVAEGAPIVVAQAPIDVRNPKKTTQPQRYMGDIVPHTKPPSTEKRGVKGRPGQRPMPKYDESVEEGLGTMPTTEYVKGIYAAAAENGMGAPDVEAVRKQMVLAANGEVDIMATMQKAFQVFQNPKFKQMLTDLDALIKQAELGQSVQEGKQKGVDGKACWKGYKRMGTKKKGGRTVDNCVKMEEQMADLEAQFLALSEEGKASRALCASSKPDSELGASQLASCKSQGLRSRDGNKSHKLGKSPKSRVKVGGHKIKGQKYGGPLPDWS